jgi:hypothetical protein
LRREEDAGAYSVHVEDWEDVEELKTGVNTKATKVSTKYTEDFFVTFVETLVYSVLTPREFS